MKEEIVSVNWNDLKSIKRAEKKKARLENQGYSLKENSENKLVYILK